MNLMTIAIVGICIMILLIFFGMNVGLAMFIVGFVGFAVTRNLTSAIGILRMVPSTMATNYSFTVIPMFILMGNAAFLSGISDGLFVACNKWLSRLPGNLACASVVACAGFGAICGSTPATTATIGTVAIPQMRQAGYKDTLSTGAISVGGGLGIMIPPSTPMIVYGVSTETSIGKLFAAGVFPGILVMTIIVIQIVIMIKLKPDLAPAGYKCAWGERFKSLIGLSGVIFLFIVVLVGMFSGYFTVNEAAAVGAFTSIVLMILKRRMTWRNMKSIILDTVKTSGMVFLLLIGAQVFGSFITITRFPMFLANFIGGLNVSPYVILAIILVIYTFLGCIMDALPMILVTIPIFYPIMIRLGFDPVWFGILLILVINLGMITPPVGLNCYIMAGVAKDIPLTTIFRGVIPFVFSLFIGIVIITIFPGIVLWLPNVLY